MVESKQDLVFETAKNIHFFTNKGMKKRRKIGRKNEYTLFEHFNITFSSSFHIVPNNNYQFGQKITHNNNQENTCPYYVIIFKM